MKTFRITNSFDNSVVEISWKGIKLKDAKKEVLSLAKEVHKSRFDYTITQL
tara:strand:+ start:858 stop:1010 length:153 start_codon:yes stop_codon:yes gene_type:complete